MFSKHTTDPCLTSIHQETGRCESLRWRKLWKSSMVNLGWASSGQMHLSMSKCIIVVGNVQQGWDSLGLPPSATG